MNRDLGLAAHLSPGRATFHDGGDLVCNFIESRAQSIDLRERFHFRSVTVTCHEVLSIFLDCIKVIRSAFSQLKAAEYGATGKAVLHAANCGCWMSFVQKQRA